MDEQQRHRLLHELSGSPFREEYCRDEFLHEMFEKNADQQPEKMALECRTTKLTYRELEERSNRLAAYLRRSGLKSGEHVILMLDKTENLYIAMLAIMKAGAAYVPIDLSFPGERVEYIIADSGARFCISSSEIWQAKGIVPGEGGVQPVLVDRDAPQIEQESPARLTPEEIGLNRSALFSSCYIIYTSGTTGKPKGCIIDHRNICNYVRGATVTYGIKGDDRILQCASVAFDASLEEIWMAFANGGTLIVGTKEIMQAGALFGEMMTQHQVTVLSCSPTLLSMVESDMDTVRLLILGGEACPHDLVKRWAGPQRTIYNSYGPTEATIVATVGELKADKPVTIGKALPNYRTYIVDEKLELVDIGAEGELLIAGPSVSRGYLNMDDLDAKRFVFTHKITGEPDCFYRTGDLVCYTEEGEIEYHGRGDDQVKLRGFRIELSEIESLLMQDPAILSAAVALHQTGQQLAAYVVLREGETIDYKALRETLKKKLPPYMIPSWLDEVASLPTSISGKINRKQLPTALQPFVDEQREIIAPRTPLEEEITAVWKEVFKLNEISVTDDFFYDLSGHSLLAAGAVSKLRKLDRFKSVAVGDIYKYPTIEGLARNIETSAAPQPSDVKREFYHATTSSYLACALAQGLAIAGLSLLHFWQWLGVFFVFAYLSNQGFEVAQAVGWAIASYAIVLPLLFIFVLAAKWLLIGRLKAGSYPLWGSYYFRYWLVCKLVEILPLNFFEGSPVLPWFYRLLGAEIGSGVYMGSASLMTFDLLRVGSGATLCAGSSVSGAWVTGGRLHLAPIAIGEKCLVGNRAVLAGNNVMGDGAALGDLSLLPEGVNIPSHELWNGSPATFSSPCHLIKNETVEWSGGLVALFALSALLLPTLMESLFFPGLLFIETMIEVPDSIGAWLLCAPFLALSYILILLLLTSLSKKILCFDMKEGCYPLNSSFYFRYWLFSQLFRHVESMLSGLFGTIYTAAWLKTLGLRLGKGSEVSYVRDIMPDMLEAGDGCFFADDASVSGAVIDGGKLYLKKTRIGDHSFIGNSAVIPAGAQIGSHCLIGVLSTVNVQTPVSDGTSWLGSPPIFLPKRQKVEEFGDAQTFTPSAKLIWQRRLIDFCKILLPMTIFISLACIVIQLVFSDFGASRIEVLLALMPLIYISAGIACILLFALLKQLLVGRYKPGVHPLWSLHVWLAELLTGLYEDLVVQFFYRILCGTPYAAWVLRCLGVKVGRRSYIQTSWITEFDMVEIGDDVALNEDANLQTHLFEDRIMKIGKITLGDRCTVGASATVLYDTELGDGCEVSDLSLIMKGEMLPENTTWQGVPGQRI